MKRKTNRNYIKELKEKLKIDKSKFRKKEMKLIRTEQKGE